ncbi:hypothetical protein MA16_Dca007614 [Dendrobium catenatum]|uniref:Uncharacterized protein n=1 Tax=Dendrobium catenatum TaxID=906689 RepID=A0A2I0X0U9_9ASPA|nr:hypothetical protein MA16_Dca007614 [Dendrobium catenatum]
MPNSDRRRRNHTISDVRAASERYSDSVDDRATVCCFLTVHETKVLPRKEQKPDVDFRETGSPAQSASENEVREKSDFVMGIP